MNVGVSIVICTHNGKNRLPIVFDYINNLQIPVQVNFEVLVVDNASTDGTSDWIIKVNLLKKWNFNILLIEEFKPGLNFARITGAKHATYDWLLFCDDDNLLDCNYIKYFYECLSNHPNLGALGGKGIALTEVPTPIWFSEYAHSFAVGSQYVMSGFVPKGSALYGAGLFVIKTPIIQIVDKGFTMIMIDRNSGKLTSGGDNEWCYLLHLSGLNLFYDDCLIFHHKLEASRLTWEYYKKLKAGIASGVGLLEPYNYFFKSDYKNSFSFLIYYIKNLFNSILVYSAVSIKAKLFSKYVTDLGLIILKSKAESYCVNLSKAYIHYKKLKRTFDATV
jgi:glycosyltransferase involved in cell wall biosynthesis